jgi:hypothetical protein
LRLHDTLVILTEVQEVREMKDESTSIQADGAIHTGQREAFGTSLCTPGGM